MADAGSKYDIGKDAWDLLPWHVLEQVAQVMLHANMTKYATDDWKHVRAHRRRYFAGTLRHLRAWMRGEKTDAESGFHPLVHVVACVLILTARELPEEVSVFEDPPIIDAVRKGQTMRSDAGPLAG